MLAQCWDKPELRELQPTLHDSAKPNDYDLPELILVTRVKTDVRLSESDEFLDLEQVDPSICTVDGVLVHVANVLSRKAIHEGRWLRIGESLVSGRG